MLLFVSEPLFHVARFSPFFGLFFNPCFVVLGLLRLFVILRGRDRYGNNGGTKYWRGRPYDPRSTTWQAPPPAPPKSQQNPTQTPGGYSAPYTGYSNPGSSANFGSEGTPTTRVEPGTSQSGGENTIRMDAPATGSGEPTRRFEPEPEAPRGRIERSEDDQTS